jgi:hypothetical protein
MEVAMLDGSTRSDTRKNKSIEEWRSIIARYQVSGLKQKQFCERERIQFGTFKTWLYRLKIEEVKDCEAHLPLFSQIMIDTQAPVGVRKEACESPLIVEIGADIRIVVASGFGQETLRRLMDVVRGVDV